MKKVSARKVRPDFLENRNLNPKPMPDIGERLQKVFGPKIISDQAMRAVMDGTRGSS